MTQVLLIKQSNRIFGISIEQIEAVTMMMTIYPLNGAPDFIKGAVNYHGSLIPLIEFGERLSLFDQCIDYSNIPRTCKIAIVDEAGCRFALVLAHAVGLHEVDEREPVDSPLNGEIVHPCLGPMHYVKKDLVQMVDVSYILSEQDKHYLANMASLETLAKKDDLDE
jgi:chemotaxis signal transduction protein